MKNCHVVKSNPKDTFALQGYLETNPKESSWTVARRAKIDDNIFIGQSGDKAGLYATATLTSEPVFGPEEDPSFWIDAEKAKIPRWRANIEFSNNLVRTPILENALRKDLRLSRVANWLHRQGAVLKLSQEEQLALNEVLSTRR